MSGARTGIVRAVILLLASAGMLGLAVGGPALPERPRLTVETAPVPGTGRTVAVPAGGDLQAALDAARPGDVITLEAGATFTGPFTLSPRDGDGWITIRTSARDGELPGPGQRVDPSHARWMPRLVAGSGAVLKTAGPAHHYRLVGLEIRPADGVFLTSLVELGGGARTVEALPHHIIVDRCYLHGDPAKGTRRGIALNARHAAVIDSHLADFKERGADSQAIAGWNGPGPFVIAGNRLEAAGENVMFGGADPGIQGLVPADIEIRGNHVTKPLAWRADGASWTVKNLLELKNARRVLIEGNLFEHGWAAAQSGFAILFTVRNQDGRAPWSSVEDVTFARNVVRHVAAGINMHGRDDQHPSQRTRRILIAQNLFEDVGGSRWGGNGTLLQIIEGVGDLRVEHNTALQSGNIIMAEGAPHERFVFRGNIVTHNEHGITGTGTAPGASTLERYFPGAVVEQNVIVGAGRARYPGENRFPGSLAEVGFVDPGRGDYRLAGGRGSLRDRAAAPAPGADPDALAMARAAAGLSAGRPGGRP
jgi:hypothetical protein